MDLCEPGCVLSVWKALPECGLIPLVFVCCSLHFFFFCRALLFPLNLCTLLSTLLQNVWVCPCVFLCLFAREYVSVFPEGPVILVGEYTSVLTQACMDGSSCMLVSLGFCLFQGPVCHTHSFKSVAVLCWIYFPAGSSIKLCICARSHLEGAL